MPLVSLTVPQEFVDDINAKLGAINGSPRHLSANDIGREALAVYAWVVRQKANGLAIVAADRQLKDLVEVTTPNIPAGFPLERKIRPATLEELKSQVKDLTKRIEKIERGAAAQKPKNALNP